LNVAVRSLSAASPVTRLRGVGPAVAARLKALGLDTLQDLLFHLPLRYEDRTHLTPLGQLRPGQLALVAARVERAEVRYPGRRMLLVSASDGTGRIWLRFFHFSAEQQRRLQVPGQWLRAYGEVRAGKPGLELVHPEYQLVADEAAAGTVVPALTPVYPATTGLQQGRLRSLIGQALRALDYPDALPDLLPDEVLVDRRLPRLAESLHLLHAPPVGENIVALLTGAHPAQRRLAFEELLAHQLGLRQLRRRVQAQRAPASAGDGRLRERFIRLLPFELTSAQARVAREILADLACGRPMLRLVQGDVGAGKTVVAALAALAAIESGQQVALMAPTELLAEQHFQNFSRWLGPLGISVALCSGRQGKAERRHTAGELASGSIALAIGTHALFQDELSFAQLGLMIVDEQHRFGVHQRLALRAKGVRNGLHPHQLVMTATPIPRTLAMSLYADLDVSVIDELPPGRTPVTTVALPETRRAEVLERVAAACRAGRQAYWVCTIIEESEMLAAQAAEDTAAHLREELPQLRIGLVHGRLKLAEKDRLMRAFKAGELDLLVATTVIEVGVDVPNASLMIIENAERLGLSQLHQLRGRVGRGAAQSHCVLVYHPPLSDMAESRLRVMRETTDGFVIAQRDLELRGPGEILGTQQTGLATMRVADLMRDAPLIPVVQLAADRMLDRHPALVPQLLRRWLGERGGQYASV
jgi:ATP-dependent DNA helicase RecG